MPKGFSEYEREAIRKNLMENAAFCMKQYGIKKTTVDELVRLTKIPKGTFYLFYPAKELLFFEVIMELHQKMEVDLYTKVQNLEGHLTVENFAKLLLETCQEVDEMGLVSVLSNGEMEHLARKLPPEVLADHDQTDHDLASELFQMLPMKEGVDVSVFVAAFRGIFCMLLMKNEMGESFWDAMYVLIKGICMQLLEVAE